LAYDPVQSLLAAGTNESQFGRGQIYVFGIKRVFSVFQTPRPASIRILQFCANRLISVDSKNEISIFDLKSKKLESSHSPPGKIATITSDPALDYIFIALQNGINHILFVSN
jgi:syntaxin-binding protein 5